MLGRREPEPTPEAQSPAPAPPSDPPSNLPIAFQGREARRRRWPPAERTTPRIASFGVRTVEQQGRRGQREQPIEIEGGYDVVDTSRTYWRHVGPNEPWHENDVSDHRTDKVIETGLWVRRRDPKRNEDGDGKRDKVTRFPPLTEAERAAAAVMRGIVGGQ